MQTNKRKSAHIFTSRTKGLDRVVTEIAIVIMLIFGICSLYAVVLAPVNPVAWSMMVFFIFGFMILVGFEENVFPDLSKHKTPYAVVTWFFAWLFCAFLVSALVTFNLTHAALAVIMAVVVFIGGTYVIASEQGWSKMKTTVKKKTGGAVKQKIKGTKTGKKISKKLEKRKRKKKSERKRRISSW